MESQLLSAAEGEVRVESWLFLLEENAAIPDEDADPSEEDAGLLDLVAETGDPDPGLVATGSEGGLILWSAGNDHNPRVRLEQWSAQPPRSQETWETVQDVSFSARETGELVLTSISGSPSEDVSPVELPHLGTYRARVHVRGREEAARHGEAEFYHGIEQWLVRIWPQLDSP